MKKLTGNLQRFYDILVEYDNQNKQFALSNRQIGEKLNCCKASAANYVSSLANLDIITREGGLKRVIKLNKNHKLCTK